MKTLKNIIVSVISLITLTVSNNAQAQEVADSVKSSPFNAAAVIGTGNSSGCFHASVENGYIHVENCNGFLVGLSADYANLAYSNNSGEYSVSYAKFGIQGSYRHNMFRPQLAFYYTTPYEVEGRTYSAPELQFALNLDFNRHSRCNFYVAPTYGYKFVKSLSAVKNEKGNNVNSYNGNAMTLGGKAGVMIKLATPSHEKTVVTGNRKITYYNDSQIFLIIEANYQYSTVDKPAGDVLKMHETGFKIGVVWKCF